MGVRDLSQVIKKHAASAVTYHSSLASFAGSRFAIDANLLTSKFFFARANEHSIPPLTTPSEHQSCPLGPNPVTAHIIHAWHHLLQTLRRHQIEPIIVFDGLSRLPAKSAENARRREKRAIQRRRGEAERVRGERLATLSQIWGGVSVADRPNVAKEFTTLVNDRDVSEPDWRLNLAISRPDLVPLPPSPPLEAAETSPLSQFSAPAPSPLPLWSISTSLSTTPPKPHVHDEVSSEEQMASLQSAQPSPTSQPLSTTPPQMPSPPYRILLPTSLRPLPDPLPLSPVLNAETPSVDGEPVSDDAVAFLQSDQFSQPSERHIPAPPPTSTKSPTVLHPAPDLSPPTPLSLPPESGVDGILVLEDPVVPLQSDQPPRPHDPISPSQPPPPTLIAPTPGFLTSDRFSAGSLLHLYEAHVADVTNAVYSKNQAAVTGKEKEFYDCILIGGEIGDLAPEKPSTSEEPSTSEAIESSLDSHMISAEAEKMGEGIRLIEGLLVQSSALEASHRHRSQGIPYGVFEEVERLAHHFGAPVIRPSPLEPHEAEGICAALCKAGLADYVVSEDTDVAIYGAPLLRKVTTKVVSDIAAQDGRSAMNVLDSVKMRDELGLSMGEMVDFALLCGTDFTDRIPKIGHVNALKLIRQYHSIEAILSNHPPLKDRDHTSYLESVATARSIFLEPPPLPIDLDLRPRSPSPDLAQYLAAWTVQKTDLFSSESADGPQVEGEDDLVARWATADDSDSVGIDSVDESFDFGDTDGFERALAKMHVGEEGVEDMAVREACRS